jgi:hypothetical protein
MMGQPPRQSSLPPQKARITQFENFNMNSMARVERVDDYDKGKIEVVFLNRTKPAPIWVFDGPKPAVGDYILVGYIDGQKNNPYMQGFFSNKAWTSNFILVEKDRIRIQFPTVEKDVTGADPTKENDPKNHLRNDTQYLNTRGYIQIDADGMTLHMPSGLPINVQADTILVKDHAGAGTTKPIARQGDPVQVSGSDSRGDSFTASGTITSGSSRIQST